MFSPKKVDMSKEDEGKESMVPVDISIQNPPKGCCVIL